MTEEPEWLKMTVDDLVDRARDRLGAHVSVDAEFGIGGRWKKRVAFARHCFVWVNADVIDSFQASCRGAPASASVSGRIVIPILGRNLQ